MALETIINKENQEIQGMNLMEKELITPSKLKQSLPLNNGAEKTVLDARRDIANILSSNDKRLLVLMGPCSIDDYDSAIDYASKLNELSHDVKDKLYLVMRTYFEKPRTNIGWKGLINDPNQDKSFDAEKGLEMSRRLLIELSKKGIPCATEFLSPFVHPYISDAISYGSIGARNSQSQTNWEFASNLPIPIGIKNSTDGNILNAVNALISVNSSHTYFEPNEKGRIVLVNSHGNKYAHIILRGGSNGPNYSEEHIKRTLQLLQEHNLSKAIVVDCSHANSNKDYTKQPTAAIDVAKQRLTNPSIKGIMLESYLVDGRGSEYGQSRTDACLGWEKTERTIKEIYKML
jgi:3-deoxy-7-phosphoheptulonate synthase